jgi:hypothetical protein
MPPIFQLLPFWVQLTLVIVPALSAVFAASALVLNIIQSRRTNAQARAALVAGCLKDFAGDKEIQSAFYAIEYDEFVYDDRFHKSDQEREIDKLLRHFANLALSWKSGLLRIEDIRPVQYYIFRIMNNPGIKDYMEFMTEWLKRAKIEQHPYAVLNELCEKLSEIRP